MSEYMHTLLISQTNENMKKTTRMMVKKARNAEMRRETNIDDEKGIIVASSPFLSCGVFSVSVCCYSENKGVALESLERDGL